MSQVFSYPEFFSVVLGMVVVGIVGGIVNHFYVPLPDVNTKPSSTPDNSEPVAPPTTNVRKSLTQSIVIGIGAALLIPVFLFLTQSRVWDTLIDPVLPTDLVAAKSVSVLLSIPTSESAKSADTAKATKPAALTLTNGNAKGSPTPGFVTLPEKVKAYLVFFSFCLIAAISGFRFITGISDRAFAGLAQKVDEIDKENKVNKVKTEGVATQTTKLATKVDQDAAVTSTKVETQTAILNELIPKANSIGALQTGTVNSVTARESTLGSNRETLIKDRLAQKGTHDDDTQKGRWGGKPESTHYRLSAKVDRIDKQGCYCAVTFWVEAKDPETHPLNDSVVFLLDSTFIEPQQTIPVGADGKATLKRLIAWGVFTAGAVTRDGETLELDLADLPGLPDCFRNATMPPSLSATT